MADGAVLESRIAQVMKCRRYGAQWSASGGSRRRHRQIGVALQANVLYLCPGEHPRVGRSMRLMTRLTTFQLHGRMREDERAGLVSVTVETTGLVRARRLHHMRERTTVRIVAIDARHGALGERMFVGSLKRRPFAVVAAGALLVNGGPLTENEAVRSVRMDLVA